MLMDQFAFSGKGSLSRYTLDINNSTRQTGCLTVQGTQAPESAFFVG